MNKLWKAKDIISKDGWTKGKLQNVYGEVCAIGAINKALSGDANTYYTFGEDEDYNSEAHTAAKTEFYKIVDLLVATIRELYGERFTSIPGFNDYSTTTKEMINHAFAHAAAEWDLTHESGSQE